MSEKGILTNGYEATGRWFLPGNADKWFFGTLKVTSGKLAKLSLSGCFSEFGELIDQPIILGVSDYGQPITLGDCLNVRTTIGGVGRSTFKAHYALIGAHFTSVDSMCFDRMYLHVDQLDNWTGISGFVTTSSASVKEVEVNFKTPQKISVVASSEAIVSIDFDYSVQKDKGIRTNVAIEQKSSLCVELLQNKRLTDYNKIRRDLQYFLEFATRGGVTLTKINFAVDQESQEGGIRRPPVFIELFAAMERKTPDETFRKNMLFTWSDLQGENLDALTRWLDLLKKTRRAVAVLMDSFFGRSAYIENKLIAVTQVAEALHRDLIGGTYQTDEVFLDNLYKDLISVIPEDVPKDWRESLKGRIRYANEYSLRKRIRQLIKGCPEAIRIAIFSNSIGIENFVEYIVGLRNLVTHDANSSKGIDGEESRLYWSIELMRLIIEMVLLQHIGFSSKLIESLYA